MKINFLLIAFTLAILSSCSTAYKTGQTPDDVYYSPARLQTDDVRKDENKNVTDNTVYTSSEDRDIRRRVHNRRYRTYDDSRSRTYDDRYNPYGYPVYGNPKTTATQNNSQPRKINLGGYTPNVPDSIKSTNPKLGVQNNIGTTNPVRTFGNPTTTPGNGSGVGNFIRKLFSVDNSSINSNNSTTNNGSPARTFDNTRSSSPNNSGSSNNSSDSKSSSPSSPSSSSTSVPVRTFKN